MFLSSVTRDTHACATSEQKIDGIARGIDAIQRALQSHPEIAAVTTSQGGVAIENITRGDKTSPIRHVADDSVNESRSWDHSAHIKDFIRAIVEEIPQHDVDPTNQEVLNPLKQLLNCLERTVVTRDLSFPECDDENEGYQEGKPPFEAAVDVLRFAKRLLHSLSYASLRYLANQSISPFRPHHHPSPFPRPPLREVCRDLPKSILRSRRVHRVGSHAFQRLPILHFL